MTDEPEADGPADVEESADRLYAVPPGEFMSLRTAQVAAAKAAGDKDLARQIGALRKPTVSAWVINVLARDAPDELQGLLDLGAALAEATRTLSGDDLRRLSVERNAAVAALVRRAASLAGEHDHAVSEAQRTEVSETLQAALADPNVAHVVRAGVLTKATRYGGFGPLDVIGAVPTARTPTPTRRSATADETTETDAADEGARAAARDAAEERLRTATAAAEQADEEAEEADREATRTGDRADELIMQAAQLRSRLAELEAETATAREQATAAARRRDSARTAARQAERERVAAETELRSLD